MAMIDTMNEVAFSYVINYAYDEFETLDDPSTNPTNMEELGEWIKQNTPTLSQYTLRFTAFYKAMLKVCSELEEYSGSEDRMWYRAWERVLAGKGYTADINFFEEASCVNTFFDGGVITQEQLNQYKTNCTLQMGMEKRWQTNGMPDVQKILNAVDKKWRAKCFDFSVLWGFEEAANPATKTLAILKYS